MSKEQAYYDYIDTQLTHFPGLLEEYRDELKRWYLTLADSASAALDRPSLFAMDKTLRAGSNAVTVGKNDDDYRVTAKCPASGELEIESVFQSIYHVPLGSVEVWVKAEDGSHSEKVTLDAQGRAVVKNLTPGVEYEVVIDHKPTQAEIDSLFSHYDVMGNDIVKWLNGKWIGFEEQPGFKAEWERLFAQSHLDSVLETVSHFIEGIWDGLKALWDGIGEIWDLLKDPEQALSDMGEGAVEIIEAIKKAAADAPETLEKAMLFASDEAALYLVARGVMIYLLMLPFQSVLNELVQLGGAVVVDVVVGIIGGIILSFIATPVVGLSYLIFRVAKTAGNIIKGIIKPIVTFFKEIFRFVKQLIEKAGSTYKRVAVNDTKPGRFHNGRVEIEAVNKPTTRLEGKGEVTPDNSQAPVNRNGDTVQSEQCTITSRCPISMVTGEELLSVQDGYLPGLLPFEWKRFYRTSAVEQCSEMGYGWSHTLSHRLWREGKEIVWQDEENKLTRFPEPTQQVPVITNTLAQSAAFAGEPNQIVILSEQGRFYTFELSKTSGQGRLIRISNHRGHHYVIDYDTAGRIKYVTTKTRVRYQFNYVEGLLADVDLYCHDFNDGSPRWVFVYTQVSYVYNKRRQLLRATNAEGETEHYSYDDRHVIQSRQLAGGAVFQWQWQGEGKSVRAVRQFSNLDNLDVRYEWDEAANSVTLINSDGSRQVYQHDEHARLVKEVDAAGGEYFKEYDDKGRLTKETDALGNATEYVYNKQGQKTAHIAPNGLTTVFRYSTFGHDKGLVTEVAQGEAVWRYQYDKSGQVTKQTNPAGHSTTYRYNDDGLVEQVRYPDGTVHSLSWDKDGHPVKEVTAQGEEIEYRYDRIGRLRQRRDRRGLTEMEYDKAGRLIRHVLPGGRVHRYRYNAYGKVTEHIDESGHRTQYEYAAPQHQVTRKIHPDGSHIEYRYNNTFNYVSDIINERGEHYAIEYTPTGHVKREQTFDGRQFLYEYDAHSQLIAKTEVGTQGTALTTRYSYDASGHLMTKILPEGDTVEYGYDEAGRLTLVDDGQRPLAYQYDVMGQLIVEYQGTAVSGYAYDNMGRPVRMVLPDGQRVDYQYSEGKLSRIGLNGRTLTEHRFRGDGLEYYRTQGALTSRFLYHEDGRMKEHMLTQEGGSPHFRNYEYHAGGELAAVKDSRRGDKVFEYDSLKRLTSSFGRVNERFEHDPAGNVLPGDRLLEWRATIKGNQLLNQGYSEYEYDEFGRLVAESPGSEGGQTRYRYDSQHRLTEVIMPDGSKAEYRYDAFGRRIEKTVTDTAQRTTTTEFLWQGDTLLSEQTAQEYRTYLYEPGTFKPLALIVGEGEAQAVPYFYHLDQIGTPMALTDGDGSVVWSADFCAYGQLATQHVEEVKNPLRFQGQYFDDESGLHYNRHRYYCPETGRFISPDPIGLAGGLNSYQYVVNPTGFVDPLGLVQGRENCPGNGSADNPAGEPEFQRVSVEPEVPGIKSEVPWSSGVTNRASKELLSGATNVTVKTREQAEELFLSLYQGKGFRNSSGFDGVGTKYYFGSKKGTYHWDDVLDKDGRVIGHGPGPHGEMKYLQIHDKSGAVIRIFFEH